MASEKQKHDAMARPGVTDEMAHAEAIGVFDSSNRSSGGRGRLKPACPSRANASLADFIQRHTSLQNRKTSYTSTAVEGNIYLYPIYHSRVTQYRFF
jgi:hypothetical protein